MHQELRTPFNHFNFFYRCWQDIEHLERQLAESHRRADEHLAELTARKEQLKISTSRKDARDARQAGIELRKRQMIIGGLSGVYTLKPLELVSLFFFLSSSWPFFSLSFLGALCK